MYGNCGRLLDCVLCEGDIILGGSWVDLGWILGGAWVDLGWILGGSGAEFKIHPRST